MLDHIKKETGGKAAGFAVAPDDARALCFVIVGFGAYLGWMMTGITPSIFTGLVAWVVGLFNSAESPGKFAGIVVLALLALAFMRDRAGIARRVLMVATGALVTVGTLAAYGFSLLGASAEVAYLAAFASVVVSVLFISLWGERLCGFDNNLALCAILASHFVGFCLTLVIAAIPLPALQAVVHVFLPAVSAIAFLGLSPLPAETHEGAAERVVPVGSPVRAFAGIGCLGIIVQFLFMFTEGKTENPNELMWVIAGASVCVVVFLAARLLRGEVEVAVLSRLILPLIVFGEFLIFAVDADQKPIEVFAIGVAWMYFRMFYWMVWRAGAMRSSKPPIVAFAIGQIVLTVGCAVGSAIYAAVGVFTPSEFVILGGVCMAAILVSVIFFDGVKLSEPKPKAAFDPADEALCERCVDLATTRYGLSRQERVIARMLIEGKDNEAIQEKLVIAPNTLRTHLRNMYKKTDTHRREDLVVLLRGVE